MQNMKVWAFALIAGAAIWFIVKSMPKYKVGDILQVTGTTETFTVTNIVTVSKEQEAIWNIAAGSKAYILQSSNPASPPFAISAAQVDTDPQWVKVG